MDGERDFERRQKLAQDHAEKAASLAEKDIKNSAKVRRDAMKEIGRALTFDPENQDAMKVLRKILTAPPKVIPREVKEELRNRQHERHRWMSRVGLMTYINLLFYAPLLVLAGVRQWSPIIAFTLLSILSAVICCFVIKQKKPSLLLIALVMMLSNIGMACTSAFFGALIVTPAVIAINVTPFALYTSKVSIAGSQFLSPP